MNFNAFLLSVSKIEKATLPAQASQFKMSPPFREQLIEKYKARIKDAKRAGVMALFYPDLTEETRLALILRNTYKGVHSAQIGFPGGKVEPSDDSLKETALRETYEEIGVPIQQIEVVKQLTEVYIPPSNFYVQPYMGISKQTPHFIKQDAEVNEIVEVTLAHFLDDGVVTSHEVQTSYDKKIEVPAFELNGHIVWGATAMMLSEIKDLLKAVL
jgi:8-oxo-dGTP pyrophosphatase MutT (NUDIX family)